MFATLIRVIKFAFQDFFRNFWLSLATVSILVLAILSINVLIIINVLTGHAVETVKQKIDITAYFKTTISEEQILNVKSYFETLTQVESVNYISKDQALAAFKEKHKDNPQILESLTEISDNPLGASLIIKAKNVEDYPTLLEILQGPQYQSMIEDKNFDDHKLIIDKINNITDKISRTGFIAAVIFVIIAILIIFNSLRVAIYTHRDEIQAQKLVGATNALVAAPFVLVGVLYAVFAMAISLLLLYPLLGFIQPYLTNFFETETFSIINYYNDNFVAIVGLQLLAGIVLVIISSLFAIRKYLRV